MNLNFLFISYNKVNGTHVSENPFMINEVLRKEWGSTAMTMSDWCVLPSSYRRTNTDLLYSFFLGLACIALPKALTLVSISRCRELTNGGRGIRQTEPLVLVRRPLGSSRSVQRRSSSLFRNVQNMHPMYGPFPI